MSDLAALQVRYRYAPRLRGARGLPMGVVDARCPYASTGALSVAGARGRLITDKCGPRMAVNREPKQYEFL
jgi:hypothetical protein